MRLPREISDRIAMLRPMLIIGVVFVHVAGVSDLPSEIQPGIFNWFAAFFKNGVFRGTVPTMSLIAGFLLFSSGLDLQPRKLFNKKLLTLGVPFVIFNFYCFLFMEGMNWKFDSAFPALAALQNSPQDLISHIFGIYTPPINGPLHFVRDMMVAIALTPLLSFLLRRCPWCGFIALLLFFGTDMDGFLIFRASSLLLFYIGGAAAVYQWNILALDKYAKQCLGLFLFACLVIIGFRIDDNTFLVGLAPFLIWPAASLLRDSRIETWALGFSQYSFFIFAAHMPIIGSAWWVMTHHARWIPYPIYWCLLPVLTVVLLKQVYDLAVIVAPAAFNFAIGARTANVVRVERRSAQRPPGAPIYSAQLRGTLVH